MSLLSRVLNHNSERGRSSSNASSTSSSRRARFSLSLALELPPVVLYGLPHESTGLIISGVLTLDIAEGNKNSSKDLFTVPSNTSAEELELESVILLLVQTIHYTKPFVLPLTLVASCKDCATQKNVLASWDVLTEPALFPSGSHAYPFSHLLPGLVAASSKIGLAQCHSYIKYDVIAVGRAGGKDTTVTLPLNISRLILRGPDRNSLRVFPPTEVTASAVLPNVMYPKSTFPIELRMDNIVSPKQDRRWRMRKLLWKLEEHTKVRAATCPRHLSKLSAIKELHRKLQMYRSLRLGVLPGVGASDGPSKNTGLHYSTIQTLMFFENPPSANSAVAAASAASAALQLGSRDVDIQEEVDEGVSNRPDEEAANFDAEFGATTVQPILLNQTSVSPDALLPQISQTSNGILPVTSNASLHPVSSVASLANEDTRDLYLDELRVVAHGDIKSGWKLDFLGKGRIDLVAEISALNCSTGLPRHVSHASSTDAASDDDGLRNDANISCDIDDPALGVHVSHVLVVEVVVAEELVHASKPTRSETLTPVSSDSSLGGGSVGVPTGAARVLRMQFKVIVTERSGLGIAWDDEVPPTYEDVRALSPPTYDQGPPGFGVRTTPAVFYGIGDTPLVSTVGRHTPSIDEVADLDEHVQEFRL